ncbi:hypothetical protein [Leadbetterella byssophila]|jgi:hypothetical protein|uniref:Uncharacterized protein n=1 Tax=Leadbetterella byssophila (strain DSM 17132 / JCM 16389 / KACC 11308 / NBRC 106382 / 4M15) TaxID=649349 RepID=E4RSZ7_LEAB4|nr:hypothetical protein [Leadbetterella byssophila]ADQ16836.1 hypothetical protein Lbys_1114 [Leadbetterella byssophila DSM 17132]
MNAREIRQAELEGEIENATEALQNQLSAYKEKGGNILIVLGILASAYALYKLLTDDDEVKASAPKNESFLRNALVGLATSVAVGFAKNQILDFMEQLMNEKK